MGENIVQLLIARGWTLFIVLFVMWLILKHIRIVPQQMAFIIERLGKYHTTYNAGFHILIPLIDRIAYRHSMKEFALDVPPQNCITQDNVGIEVDGVLYMRVIDAMKASYGIQDYNYASIQLAQTTMRSIIGTMPLDKTFEERENINHKVITAVDTATDPWGIKVTRYEIKAITPPKSIQDAMEKEMRAEREKRALIAESLGKKEARINAAQGEREQLIQESEGEKQRRINEADGKAYEIRAMAEATALGLKIVADAINQPGGRDAVSLKIAEQFVQEFGKLAKENNTMIIPSNLADIASFIATATSAIDWKRMKREEQDS
ncbi:MAG: paraslipin [Synergistaceae bacterium]|jgi:regulator of protease activity HflC (stomatin/prohibitin superfamily)|nr:paraslipin [Synergistaceae bacterium]